jgi:hypothetical protein
MKHPANGGTIIYQIRRCTPDILAIRKAKKKSEQEREQKLQAALSLHQPPPQPLQQQQQQQQQQPIHQQSLHTQSVSNMNFANHSHHRSFNQTDTTDSSSLNASSTHPPQVPCLIELSHEGFEVPSGRVIALKTDHYDFGNDKQLASSPCYILLDAGIPGIEKRHCSIKKSTDNLVVVVPYAEVYVNDRLCKEPTQLQTNFTVRLGKHCLFRLEIGAEPGVQAGAPKPPMSIPANYGTLYDSSQQQASERGRLKKQIYKFKIDGRISPSCLAKLIIMALVLFRS